MPMTKCGNCGSPAYISEKNAEEGAEVYCSASCAGAAPNDELDSPYECQMVGYSFAMTGDTVETMLQILTDEYGPLFEWQRNSLVGGWDAGQADLEAYKQDQQALGPVVSLPVDDSEIPF